VVAGARLEQLWFGWFPEGLEGRNRFQIRAASPGFADPTGAQTTTAVQLCQYRPPAGAGSAEPPVSFGWIDHSGIRYAFRRVSTGTDGWGRPGAFFAHVIAGAIDDLAATVILGTFGTDLWQDDAPPGHGLELPWLDASCLPVALEDDVDEAQSAAFIEALLRARAEGSQLFTVADPAALVGWCEVALERLPAVATAGLSFSTYEAGTSSEWFDLVGVADPPRAARHVFRASTEPRAGRPFEVIANGSQGGALRVIAQACHQNGRYDPARFLGFVEAVFGGDSIDHETLLGLLAGGAVAPEIFDVPAVMRGVATAVTTGGLPPATLAGALSRLHGSHIDDLAARVARDLAERFARGESSAVEETIRRILELSRGLFDAVGGLLFAHLEADAPHPVELQPATRYCLLRFAERKRGPLVDELLDVAAEAVGEVLAHRDVDARLRAQIVLRAGDELDRQGRATLTRQLADEPTLARALGQMDPELAERLVLDAAGTGYVEACTALAGTVDERSVRQRLVLAALAASAPVERLRLLVRLARSQRLEVDSERLGTLIAQALDEANPLQRADAPDPAELAPVLNRIPDEWCRAWGAAFTAQGSLHGSRVTQRTVLAFVQSIRNVEPWLPGMMSEILPSAVLACPSSQLVHQLLRAVHTIGGFPLNDLVRVLRPVSRRHPMVAFWVVFYVAEVAVAAPEQKLPDLGPLLELLAPNQADAIARKVEGLPPGVRRAFGVSVNRLPLRMPPLSLRRPGGRD
jgi:hypothetical protein